MRRIPMALVPFLLAGGFAVPAASAPAAAPRCGGMVATIVGTAGSDHLWGTPGPDVIAALGANDVVKGRGGDDVICGGPGTDSINGQGGSDRLLGGAHGDNLEDSRGRDELRGGRGDDALISVSRRPSRLYGGPGYDALRGYLTDEPGYLFDAGSDLDDILLTTASAGPLVVIDRGAGTISRDGVVTGRFRGNEFIALEGLSPYSYVGTDERDFVIVRVTDLPFRAETFGGPDFVDSSAGGADDYLDLGAGDDVAKAGDGLDTCLHAEKAKGCEIVSP